MGAIERGSGGVMKFSMKCEVCTLVDNSGRRLCESCEEMVKRLITIEKRTNGCTVHLSDNVPDSSDHLFSASAGGKE